MHIAGIKVLNTEILANPANWVIVTLMVLIAGVGLDILLKGWKSSQQEPA